MTVAIISEYNPFHTGHKYQIDSIRKHFGKNTNIIAVMSGNFTQRGEVAIADKYVRAEWAVLAGVNLVLELPFPHSMSSAEIFAKSAIKIIDSLGVADYLSFGSESGDCELLSKIAKNMQTTEYRKAFMALSKNTDTKTLGYPAICELAYKNVFSEKMSPEFFLPNNILAIEYIKAIKEQKSSLKIHTVKRQGADYNASEISKADEYQSAMSIRKKLTDSYESVIPHIPNEMRASFSDNFKKGNFPTNQDKLSSAIISHFRLNTRDDEKCIFDIGGGLYNRLKNASIEADSISALITLAETKKFTNARIRRAIWYSFFGVTSSDVKELPKFTQVLGLDKKGRALLKSIKERSDFPIITKPSASDALETNALRQKKALDKADSVFQLTKPKNVSGASSLRAKPFVKD